VAYPAALGLLLGLAGQPEAGVVELERLIHTPGYRSPTAHVNLGWIYRNMDPPNLEAAVAAYHKALQLAPNSGQAALGLGWAFYHLSRWDEAIEAFQMALEVGPRFLGEANYGIARSYYFKRQMAQARSHLAKAKAAGHDVTSLELAIRRYEEALAESAEKARRLLRQQEQRRVAAESETRLIRRLQDSEASTEARSRAARGLGRSAGPRAVAALIWALRADDRDLRLSAAQALGEAGPAATEALPTLRHIVETIEDPKVFATRAEVEESIKDADVRRAARDAILRIAPEQ
jgi:tetratricopeptide (TPR) repeat protein